jgi:hypothetical protein
MKDITNILNYEVHWRDKSRSGFIGELFFVIKNTSGGSLSTPVGHLIGFTKPASEYSNSYWKILLTIRDEISIMNRTTQLMFLLKVLMPIN